MRITKYTPRRAEVGFPFDNSLSTMLNDLMSWNRGGAITSWSPEVDIIESEDNYEIHAELPGMKEEDVNITLNNNVLTLSGEKRQEMRDEKQDYVRVERTYGKFERSFSLPSNIMADRVDANYQDGVLTVTIPKAEEAKSRTIKIKR